MDQLIIDMSADLDALSYDELVEMSYELQRQDDILRDYRRQVKAAYGQKQNAETALAKLSPAERAALGIKHVEIKPETVNATFKVGE